jgi:endonuclease/exonuclease/phosphatase (EEP) superfamily protein YafD
MKQKFEEPVRKDYVKGHSHLETTTYFPLPGKRYGINVQTQVEFLVPKSRMGVRVIVHLDDQTRIQVATADLVHNPVLKTPFSQIPSVATTHYTEKAIEMQRIKQELHKESLPFLFLCDCNMQDAIAAYAQLATFAKDSFREVGWGFGNTVDARTILNNRLDYIWHSDKFVAITATTGPDGQSDHLPVVAEFFYRKEL